MDPLNGGMLDEVVITAPKVRKEEKNTVLDYLNSLLGNAPGIISAFTGTPQNKVVAGSVGSGQQPSGRMNPLVWIGIAVLAAVGLIVVLKKKG